MPIGVILLLLTMVASGREPESPLALSLERAGKALEMRQWDEAVAQYIEASHQGMSQDSLMYFLAGTALAKGAADTALVFNFAIGFQPKTPLHTAAINQRMRIYTELGMESEVARLQDSLASPFRRDVASWFPKGKLRLGSGYSHETVVEEALFPDRPGPDGPPNAVLQGHFRRLQAGLEWSVGLGKTTTLEIESGYRSFKAIYRDSSKSDLGVELRMTRLWKHLFAGLGFWRVDNGYNPVSHLQRSDISLVTLTRKSLHLANLGFERDFYGDQRRKHEMLWALYYWDLNIATAEGFNLTVSANGYFADAQRMERLKIIFVESGTMGRTEHFTDRTFTQRVPGNRFTSAVNSLNYFEREDQVSRLDYWAVSVAPAYTHPLFSRWDGSIQVGFSAFYYPRDFVWQQISPVIPIPSLPLTVAYSRLEGRYFYVDEQKIGGDDLFNEDTPVFDLQKYSQKRVDLSSELTLTLKRKTLRWGTLEFRSQARYLHSNLAEHAPVEIPKWDIGVGFDWRNKWEFL